MSVTSDIDIDHELENFDMEVEPDAWRFDVGVSGALFDNAPRVALN
jgi:hypothetical protein